MPSALPRCATVLVIEDDDLIADVLRLALEDEGYCAHRARDGWHGVRAAAELEPGVILLDLNLPKLDGRSVLAQLKAKPRTARIPVVVVTALPEALSRSERTLVAAVLAKPFDVDVLIAAVRKALG